MAAFLQPSSSTSTNTSSSSRTSYSSGTITSTSKIEEVINEKIAWLEENQDADSDEMKAQKKEMEDIVQPIIAKLYQMWRLDVEDQIHINA